MPPSERTLPAITRDDVLAREPCWSDADERLRKLDERYRRTRWTALEILSLDEVSAEDRLWVVLRDSVLPAAVLRRFAVEVAADAMRRVGWWDTRSWAALHAALAFERGEIDDAACAAAWAAARTAVCDAARDAAWAAASAAAWAAARDAASAAASAAANAARDAARDAAWAAARGAAIRPLRQITLRWLDGEDVLAGGVWSREQRLRAKARELREGK